MGRKTIPPEQKELVKKRVIRGASTREAIKGTVIKSHRTVSHLIKAEMPDITQKRAAYVQLIKEKGADDEKRAERLVELVHDPQYGLQTIKYIDALDGLAAPSEDEVRGPSNITVNFIGINQDNIEKWS